MSNDTSKVYGSVSAVTSSQARPASLFVPARPQMMLFVLYSGLVALSSLFYTAPHTHHPVALAILFFVLLLAGGLASRHFPTGFWGLLSSPYFALACVVFLAIFGEVHYRTKIEPRPEFTAAPALVESAKKMLHGQDPYTVRLANGAPISPGPGWILLLAPLSLLHGAGLIHAVALALVAFLLGQRSSLSRGIFVLLMMVQILFVNESQWGTDLFAVFLVFGALCLLADRWIGNSHLMLLLGVMAGFFIQARVPMILFFAILALGVWRKDAGSAKWLTLPALALSVCFFAAFYLWTLHDKVFFQPFHLAGRARASGPTAGILTRVATAVALLWIGWKLDTRVTSWLLAGGFLALAMFAPTGLGELVNGAPTLGMWEGANYITLGLSLFAMYLALEGRPARAGSAPAAL